MIGLRWKGSNEIAMVIDLQARAVARLYSILVVDGISGPQIVV